MLPNPYRVLRLSKETHDTFTLELVPLNEGAAPGFAPGQFNMLYAFGVGEVPISISGDPAQGRTLIHTIRAVGAVTEAMRRVKRGDVLGVRGPFGTHWPTTEAEGKDVVIVTGGIGLAPLRPVIYHLLAHRPKYGKIALLYGARTPQDLLYAAELARWRGQFDLQVEATVDSGADDWHGNVGVVTNLLPRAQFDSADTIALTCGPEVMMRFVLIELQKRGLGAEQIFVSMERNMQCGIGLCGHCQLGPLFICKDGPVFRYDRIQAWFGKREL
jgi:NAD(P)H-flavin reductase